MTTAWREVELGEVAEFVRGITFKPADVEPLGTSGSIACMRTANVQAELDLEDVWAVPESFCRRDDQRLRQGDLLVSTANSWNLVGKCAWVGELPWPSTFGGFVSALRPASPDLDARYLYRWFASPRIQATVRSYGRRTTSISNLSLDQCRALRMPLPPIDEQKRIVSVLDQADDLRAKRQSSLALTDSLRESIFRNMFELQRTSPVTAAPSAPEHPARWKWETLTDVARLATGHTPDRNRPEYWNGDIPWISLTEIRQLDGRIAYDTELTVTEKGIRNSSAVVLPQGTVCFSRTASIGFVTVMGREMSTSQDFVNWICGDRLDPTYLMWALIVARPHLRALSTGSTHKTIYMRVAEKFRVLVPPIELQREFAARVAELTRAARNHERSATVLEELFASLQHRAFAGQL